MRTNKYFLGPLIPAWINAPSTLQHGHEHHGENIVAVKLEDGNYQCSNIDAKVANTFILPSDTPLVDGWRK